MLKNFSIKNLIVIGLIVLCSLCACSFITVKAENYNEEQQGISLYKDYDISTANDGKYSSLLLNKNGDLSDYYKNYYSGGLVDFTSGYMYETNADGISSTVNLIEAYNGKFSIIGQGFYDEYSVENSTFVADYGRLAFQFTNLSNPNQYYKFSFVQSIYHYLELNIYYYDKTEQETSLYKITKKMSYSFTEKSAYMQNKNLPFRFEYDMATQTLNMRDEKVSQGQTHNLNQLSGANLPVFENYSVDMHFENKSQKNTAKFIIYELCGQSLAGEQLTDTALPVMLSISVENKKLKAKAYDLVDGAIESGFTFKVKAPNGNDVTNKQDSSKFDFITYGEYTVTAFVSDKAGNKALEKTVKIIVEKDVVKPIITILGQYRGAYLKGESVNILDFTATDDGGITNKGVSVYKDGKAVQVENKILQLDDLGDYDIVYYAVDASNNRQEVKKTITVAELFVAEKVDIQASLTAQSIPQLTVPSGWYYKTEMYLKTDTEKANVIGLDNGKFVFDDINQYVVFYSVIPEFETQTKITYQTEINVIDTIKPLIELSGEYQESYNLNENLSLITANVTENTDNYNLTVEVFNETGKVDVSEDGIVLLNKTGNYEIIYTAVDGAGNQETYKINFTVVNEKIDGNSFNNGIIIPVVIGSVLVVAGIIIAIVLVKRKR